MEENLPARYGDCVDGQSTFTRDSQDRLRPISPPPPLSTIHLPKNLNTSQINAISVIPTLSRAAGGPTFSVSALCEAAASVGVNHSLLTVQAASDQPEHLPNPDLVRTVRVPGYHFPQFRFSWSPSFATALYGICRERSIHVIQSHGIWTQANHLAASGARKLGLPLVVSIHGMLEPWAWRYHAWKKRPAWWLWERRNLRSAVVLRATAQQEVEALRLLGLRNPIALIPNGVDLPAAKESPKNEARHSKVRRALFISRVHPKKGLLNLVTAWAQVRPVGWQAVICGPDEGGHTGQVKQAATDAGLSDQFDFTGPVYGGEKEALYANADLFVLPTFSENFGVAIAEALAAEVPVITTKGAPWKELVGHRCGWWIDIGVEPLAAALREATSLTDEERHEMGQRGRRLVEEKYSWAQIGRDMRAVYEWVCGKGPRPECVQVQS